jgi:biotin carboxyl carrier protein
VAAKHLPSLLARILLLTAGLCIAGWGATQVMSRVRSVISSQAMVNGHIVTLTAADPGTVAIDQILQSGMGVTRSQVLLKLLNPKTDPWLRDARIELALDRSRLAALMTQVNYQRRHSNSLFSSFSRNSLNPASLNPASLDPIDNPDAIEAPPIAPPPSLPTGGVTFTFSTIADLQRIDLSKLDPESIDPSSVDPALFSPGKQTALRLAEETVKQAAIQVTLAEQEASLAETKYNKLNQLGQAGAVGSLTVEEAYKDWQMKQERAEGNRIELQKKEIERDEQRRLAVIDAIEKQQAIAKKRLELSRSLKAEREPLTTELPVPISPSPLPPIQPSLVKPQPSATPFDFDLWRQAQELQAKIRSREAAIAQAQTEPHNRDRDIVSPHDGVIWSVMTRQGEEVGEAQALVKILDCRQIWVDAFISVDDLPKVTIGQPAEVRLQGVAQPIPGIVRNARPYFLGPDNSIGLDSAIKPPVLDQKQLAQVRVEFSRPEQILELPGSQSRFCYVGQLAEVHLPIAP